MSNVMEMRNVRNHVHRNGFDLSQKKMFTAHVGELIPCYVREVLPGDDFSIDSSIFTRTCPVNTAAYSRIKEHVEFFFVPYRLLWDKFPQWITQMQDAKYAASILSNAIGFTNSPYMTDGDYMSMLDALKTVSGSLSSTDELGFDWYIQHKKLAQSLGYGAFFEDALTGTAVGNEQNALQLWRFAAYQKVYQDYYRNSQWEQASAFTYNFDYILNNSQTYIDVKSAFGTSVNAPYRNSIFTLRYANWNKDYLMGLLPSAQFGDESIAGPVVGISSSVLNGTLNNLTVWSSLTTSNSVSRPIGAGNLQGSGSGDDIYRLQNLITSNSLASSGATNLGIPLGDKGNDVSVRFPSSFFETSGISVLAIRQAQALQKWKEISQSGSRDYREQLSKHWNVKVDVSQSDLCQRLGGFSSRIDVSEVLNTNLSNNGDADIAGKGVGASQGKVRFHNDTQDYGIILGIYHAEPLLDYQANAYLPRELTKVMSTDFAIPEMDSIGMQETYATEVLLDYAAQTTWGKTVGYAPRYAEYKTALDEISGGFLYEGAYANWVAPLTLEYVLRNFSVSGTNSLNYTYFKINPSIMNPIFVPQVTQQLQSDFSDDQFLVNMYHDVKAVRNLSESGLPY